MAGMDPRPSRLPASVDMGTHGPAMLSAANAAHIGVTVSVVEPEGSRNVFVSEVAAEILGFPQAELLARDPMACIAPEDHPRLRERLGARQRGETGTAFYELTAVRKDGTRVSLEVSATDVLLDGHRAVLSFIFDISARKAAEETRLRSEARFRELIEKAPEGICITRDWSIVYANAALVGTMGFGSAKELYDVPLTRLVSPEDLAALEVRLKVLTEDLPRLPAQIYRARRPDGTTLLVEASSVPFEYEGKRSILSLIRDVTERRALEARLVQADRLAALGTLAAGVAHEINNPLAYVMLNLDWIARKLAEGATDPASIEAMKEMLREARGGAARVATIVHELRSFSRSDGEARRPIDLTDVVRAAIRIAGHEIRPRAQVTTSFDPTPLVWATEGRVEQVVINLLLNAAQAMPETRAATNEIRVSVRTDGAARVVLEVSDNAEGIPPEILSRIFDPFFTTKPPGLGTGLGLSICHGIVTSLGGQITVHSEPHEGTTFRVSLPAAPLEAGEPVPPSERQPQPSAQRARVLIVDDEVHIASTMRELLAHDHDVVAVTSGAEAFGALRTGVDFDVIFCDLMMPDVTGMDLYRRVRDEKPGFERRIVFMTGGAFTPRAAEFLASVDNPRLEKPFSLSLVERTVRDMVSGRRPRAAVAFPGAHA
jgi:PAS domain S-box-containing protein